MGGGVWEGALRSGRVWREGLRGEETDRLGHCRLKEAAMWGVGVAVGG